MNDFRLYAPFTKIAKQADGTIRAHSVIHDEAVDDQGEIIDYDGGKAAIEEFMKWAAVREMHTSSAVGVVESVFHDDVARVSEGILHIVDPVAVQKVEAGVYKGTSWGGMKGTQRALEKIGGHTATRLMAPTFIELSLVDRPSRPTAVLTMLKRSDAGPVTEGAQMGKTATTAAAVPTVSRETPPAGEPLAKAAADDLFDTHMLEESLARMIETEAGEESPNTGRIEKYKAALALLQEADAIAAAELGSTSDTTEAAEEQAEADADFDEMVAATTPTTIAVLSASAKPGDLRKVGARNSAQDQAALDQIVALGIGLGGTVPPPPEDTDAAAAAAAAAPAAPAAPIAKGAGLAAGALADQIIDRLAKTSGFVRADDMAAMKAEILGAFAPMQEELRKIAAQPAPGGPMRMATDPRGILGPQPAAAQSGAMDEVLAKISNPQEREAVGMALAVQGVKAAHGG